MPGPIHFTPPPPKPDQWRVFEAYGARDPNWKPGPMAPPPAYKYPDVWAKKRKR